MTIKKPAVIEPSQAPRINLTIKRPAKFLHAAWEQSATAQTKMLKLLTSKDSSSLGKGYYGPHPFRYWKFLQEKVLRKLEREITEIKYGPQPGVETPSLASASNVRHVVRWLHQLYLMGEIRWIDGV